MFSKKVMKIVVSYLNKNIKKLIIENGANLIYYKEKVYKDVDKKFAYNIDFIYYHENKYYYQCIGNTVENVRFYLTEDFPLLVINGFTNYYADKRLSSIMKLNFFDKGILSGKFLLDKAKYSVRITFPTKKLDEVIDKTFDNSFSFCMELNRMNLNNVKMLKSESISLEELEIHLEETKNNIIKFLDNTENLNLLILGSEYRELYEDAYKIIDESKNYTKYETFLKDSKEILKKLEETLNMEDTSKIESDIKEILDSNFKLFEV